MLVLTLLAFAVVSVPAYFCFSAIVNSTVVKLGTLFAEKQILFDRYRGLGALMQEVKLAETLARSDAVREWASNEADPERKARGIAELEHYREAFTDHSYFFVVGASGNYYFNDAANSYAGKQLSYQLDPANPRDGWYYRTAALGEGCHLNVDQDDVLQVTKVWINCVVVEGGKVIGVLGSGLDLSSFIREVVDIPQTGVTAMFVDRAGAVQAHRDPRLVDFHSITKDIANKKTIYALLDREDDRAAMQRIMDEVTTSEVVVKSAFMRIGGHEVLVGVGYLDRLGWYNVTIMDVDKIIDRGLFLPIGALLAVLMLASAAAVALVFKRRVLDRLARMQAQFATVEGGKFAPSEVDKSDDEIGHLWRAFAGMASKVSGNTRMLEDEVEARTAELRALAYRDQLTGIANRRGFVDAYEQIRLKNQGGMLGLLLIDIDDFKSINDTHGHLVGDRVVEEAAGRLTRLLRPVDACGRWGGDEFIFVVGGIKPGELGPLAEAVKVAISGQPIELEDGSAVSITVSVGASELRAGADIDDATELADAALYRAKAEGRNRAVAFDPSWGMGRRSA